MNYQKHYDLLIERSRNRVLDSYTEKHHVLPKCLGGKDDEDNLVKLTPEEHFVAHQLLTKIYPDNSKLAYAAHMMSVNNGKNQRNNKTYGWLRKNLSKHFSELMKGNKYQSNRKNYKHSDETKQKMSDVAKGRKFSDEHRLKMSQARKGKIPWNKGLTVTDDRVKNSMRNLPYNKREQV